MAIPSKIFEYMLFPAWVLALEKRVTSFRFWSNFMNSPIPKGSVVFNMDDVDVRYFEAEGEGMNARPKLPERHPDGRTINYQFYTAVDPNTEEKNANDPAVVLTVAIDDQGHFWMVRMDRGHPNQSVLIDWIRHHIVSFSPKTCFIEAVAHQRVAEAGQKEEELVFPTRPTGASPASEAVILLIALDAGATAFQRGFMFGKDHCSQADRQSTGWGRAVSLRK
jgi:hypothetical protein